MGIDFFPSDAFLKLSFALFLYLDVSFEGEHSFRPEAGYCNAVF